MKAIINRLRRLENAARPHEPDRLILDLLRKRQKRHYGEDYERPQNTCWV